MCLEVLVSLDFLLSSFALELPLFLSLDFLGLPWSLLGGLAIPLDLEFYEATNNRLDLLVIGRPIIGSSNPLESLNQALDDIEL